MNNITGYNLRLKFIYTLLPEITRLYKNITPLLLNKGGIAGRGIFLTWLLSQLGTNQLAAGALVLSLFAITANLAMGLLTSVNISASQAAGQNSTEKIAQIVQQGFWLAILFAIPFSMFFIFLKPILILFGQQQSIVQYAADFAKGIGIAILPYSICTMIYQFYISQSMTRWVMIFSFGSILFIVSAGYIIGLGKFSSPVLGLKGLGWAFTLAYWITVPILFVHLKSRRSFQKYFLCKKLQIDWRHLKELWQIGWPVSLKFCAEVSVFMLIALILGHLNAKFLAAQQVIMQFYLVTYSLLDAFSFVIMSRVSQMRGGCNTQALKRVAISGLITSTFMVIFIVTLFLLFSQSITSLFFKSNTVPFKLVVSALPVVAAFQLFDCWRVILASILLGFKDSQFALFAEMIAFWLIGLPIGIILLVKFDLGLRGLWEGLLAGIVIGAMLMALRYQRNFSKINVEAKLSTDAL